MYVCAFFTSVCACVCVIGCGSYCFLLFYFCEGSISIEATQFLAQSLPRPTKQQMFDGNEEEAVAGEAQVRAPRKRPLDGSSDADPSNGHTEPPSCTQS